MTHSDDVGRPRRRGRQTVSAALVVLAAAGWAGAVSAADQPGRVGAGPVGAIVIDPHTPTTLYASTLCAGVLKSTDRGSTWAVVSAGLTRTDVYHLAIDRVVPSSLYATAGLGVYKSTDGGESWNAVSTGLPEYTQFGALAIDPVTPGTLYAGTYGQGVFKSTHGGDNWGATGLSTYDIFALAIDPVTPSTLFAGVGTGYGVFKSTDAGSTWSAVNAGLTDPWVTALAIDPMTPSTLYAGTGIAGGEGAARVFKSTDGGSTWSALNAGLTDTSVYALAIDPGTPSTLYVGTRPDGLFKSTDGGSSWRATNAGLPNVPFNTYAGALAIDPATPSTLYVAPDDGRGGGIFKSTDGGNSWQATGWGGDLICGDGVVITGCGEQCDDGNTVSGDGCDSNCTPTGCGNGVVTMGEECDDGNTVSDDGCDADCTLTACGNGILTRGEECDDGNRVDGNGCDSNCTVTRCGNGIVTAGEECDDGNGYPSDGCTTHCTICGDGIVTPPEECDDGNTNPADGCTNACTRCGNGIVTYPEECDDGNRVDGDGCAATCTVPGALCGNDRIDADEECDDGGLCIGSLNTGTYCTAQGHCQGGECTTFGGDGCAANCTLETDVTFNFAPGVVEGPDIAAGTSGAVIHGDILTIPLPFSGSQALTIGKARDGQIPVVIKADAVHLARIPVGTLGCACLRAVAAKTCGGTAFESDGVTQSPDCTPGFTAGDSVCAGKHACAFLHGPGNSASGVIGCNTLDGVNVSLTQDSGGAPRPPLLTLSGTGGAGSAMLFATSAIGGRLYGGGLCTGQDASVYGPDGEFCTDDDPQSQRGSPVTGAVTTGTITGRLLNANQVDGNDIGPFAVTGHPFNCGLLAGGNASGAALASVSVELARRAVGDVVTTNLLVEGRPAPSPTPSPSPGPGALVGDCHGDGQVTVDELLTMVNIVLGTAQLSACPPITTWAAGSGINVALIIQAVNTALSSPGGG